MSPRMASASSNFPPACWRRLQQAWSEVAKDEGDQDYFFRTVLDDIEKFRAKCAQSPLRRRRRAATSRLSRVRPAETKATP